MAGGNEMNVVDSELSLSDLDVHDDQEIIQVLG